MTIIFSHKPRRKRKSYNPDNISIRNDRGGVLKDGYDFLVAKSGNIIIYKEPPVLITLAHKDKIYPAYSSLLKI